MRTITITQCDTAPGVIIVIYDRSVLCNDYGLGAAVSTHTAIEFPTSTPVVTGQVDLSDSRVSVLCKMRSSGSDTNIFSCFAQKIDGGVDGGVLLYWPFFGTDVDEGNYEIEVTVCWGIRTQTVMDVIPVYIRAKFPHGGIIADEENVAWRGGSIYIRNTDTRDVHAISLVGDPYSTISLATGTSLDDVDDAVDNVVVRIIDGQLVMLNSDTTSWHPLSLKGSPTPYLEIGNKIDTVNAGGVENINIATVRGKLYIKNLDTNKWHQVTILGTEGAQTIGIDSEETL